MQPLQCVTLQFTDAQQMLLHIAELVQIRYVFQLLDPGFFLSICSVHFLSPAPPFLSSLFLTVKPLPLPSPSPPLPSLSPPLPSLSPPLPSLSPPLPSLSSLSS
nr:extensin-like [Drosophila takahashii]